MPGLDGFETVELIKRRDRHEDTAVIFLTAGDADAEQITRGYSAGAVDYILKPVDADVLRSKVAMLLELQQKNAELRASEERFRAAFEGAPIGMGLSTIDGHWLEVNDALCELLGRTQTQLLEQPLWELAHPADRDAGARRRPAPAPRPPAVRPVREALHAPERRRGARARERLAHRGRPRPPAGLHLAARGRDRAAPRRGRARRARRGRGRGHDDREAPAGDRGGARAPRAARPARRAGDAALGGVRRGHRAHPASGPRGRAALRRRRRGRTG